MTSRKPGRVLYATAARRAILELLKREQRYLTAGSVYLLLKDANPKLALSTVYRTLELLESLGTVSSRSEASGESSYVHCSDEHHHHALCTVCGHVDDVDCAAMEQFKATLLAKQSFLLDEHSVEFYGRCADCR